MNRPITTIGTLLCITLALARSPARAAPLKSLGQMTTQEVRDEVHDRYRDDLPFAKTIHDLTQSADKAWPTLDRARQIHYEVHVYARLMDALRLLTNQTTEPASKQARQYLAAVNVSLAIDGIDQTEQHVQFYRDLFDSPEFKQTKSPFNQAVIEIWSRFDKAHKPIPYTTLLLLNQPGMDKQVGDTTYSQVASLYQQAGDHAAAAKWYERVSPAFLGPLKTADALFDAEQYDQAARKYRDVLSSLDEWSKLKPALKQTALAEPLESADMDAIRKHAQERLDKIAAPEKRP